MTQLTKAERYIFYKNLLDVVCCDRSVKHGFCYYIDAAAKACGGDTFELYEDYIFECDFIKDHLPELYRIKPTNKDDWDYWFPLTKEGWQIRIDKLDNIIKRM